MRILAILLEAVVQAVTEDNGWKYVAMILGSSVLSIAISKMFDYKKNKAETKKLVIEADGMAANNWKNLLEHSQLREQVLLSEMADLRKTMTELRDRETSYLQSTVSLLQENKKLNEKVTFLENENEMMGKKVEEQETQIAELKRQMQNN